MFEGRKKKRKREFEKRRLPLPEGARAADLQRMEWGNTYMEEIVFPSGERLLPSGEIIPSPDNHDCATSSEGDPSGKEASLR